jgi:hypothetical protein
VGIQNRELQRNGKKVDGHSNYKAGREGTDDDPVVLRQGEVRGQNPIDQNWGAGSPAPGVVPADNWSARYLGTFNFAGGDCVFNATADDGVRVYIDGILVIDGWYDGYKQLSNTFRQIGAGNHLITVVFHVGSAPMLN